MFRLPNMLPAQNFFKQCFISTHPQCCFTFSWIDLQMLLRCCLIHVSITILRQFLRFLYLCLCLRLFLPYLLWSIFHAHFHYNQPQNVFKTETLVFFSYNENVFYYFGWKRGSRKRIVSKWQNFSLRVLLIWNRQFHLCQSFPPEIHFCYLGNSSKLKSTNSK